MQVLALIVLLAVPAAALPGMNGAPIKMIYDDHTHGMSPECHHASRESGYVHREPAKDLYKAKPVKEAFFLNRKDAYKRAAHMQAQCKAGLKGTKCRKFTAVEAEKEVKKMSKMELKQFSSGETTEWMKKATKTRQHIFMAIFLTNSKAIQHIADSDPEGIQNDDLYLIMEDDSVILPGFNEKVKKLLDHTPADWQVLRLGYWGQVRCEDRVNQYALSIQYPSVDRKAIGEDHFYSGNQGYLLRGSAIPEIISIMKEHNMGAIENAFMYPSIKGRQIISYGVAPEFKLIGMTHDGIEGASAKADHKRSSLLAKHEKLSHTESEYQEVYGHLKHEFKAFVEARSHPRTNITECVANVKTALPKFSTKRATYGGSKKFFYINVNEKGSRSANMQALFKSQNNKLPALRVQGVTKQDIQKGVVDITDYSNGKVANYMQEYSAHTRLVTSAIWLSHARALQTIADQDDGSDPNAVYVILEDDAWFEQGWEAKLKTLVEHTPDDWDMLKLGYWGNRHCVDKINHFVYQANGPTFHEGTLFYQGNTGYAVRAGSVKRILAALKQNPVMDVDGTFLSDNGKEDCKGVCLKVYAASMKKVFIVDRNLGTFRADLKGNKKERKMMYAGWSGSELDGDIREV